MTMRYLVSGRVQGVCFRASTRDQAVREGIEGWVRNLADGRVEVLADSVDAEALQRFERWLQHGPAHARVDAVGREFSDELAAGGFVIR